MAQTPVGLTAVRLDTADARPCQFLAVNRGTVAIYVGTTSGVTTATGLQVDVGGYYAVDLTAAAAAVWAISGSAAQRVDVISQ
jgi:hypothetical protein